LSIKIPKSQQAVAGPEVEAAAVVARAGAVQEEVVEMTVDFVRVKI
jgi:hypothetical protein